MYKLCLFILCLAFYQMIGYGQNIIANTNSYYGFWNNASSTYAYGGGSLELLYEHPLNRGALQGGMEIRSIDWGNQVSLKIAYKMPYLTKEKWEISGLSAIGLGTALFKKNPMFVWSIGYLPEFTFRKQKRMQFNLGVGLRYSHNPAYIKYGQINQLLEVPLKIGITIRIKK